MHYLCVRMKEKVLFSKYMFIGTFVIKYLIKSWLNQ
jgi:hypothetical protein